MKLLSCLFLMIFETLLHISSCKEYTYFGKRGRTLEFMCDTESAQSAATYYLKKQIYQEVEPFTLYSYSGTNNKPDTVIPPWTTQQRNITEDVQNMVVKYKSKTSSLQLSFNKFNCLNVAVYSCFNTLTKAEDYTYAHVKLLNAVRIFVNNENTSGSSIIKASFMQGATVVIKCSAEISPHSIVWEWKKICDGEYSYQTVREDWNVEIESTFGAKSDSCVLDYNNSTLMFAITPRYDGCCFRCLMSYREDLTKETDSVLVNKTVQVSIDWERKSAGFSEPCVEHFGEDFYLLPLTVVLSCVLYGITILLALQKGFFKDLMRWYRERQGQKKESITTEEMSK